MLAVLQSAVDVSQNPTLDLSSVGVYGVVLSLLLWFLRSTLTTIDKRLGEIVDKIGVMATNHQATVDRVCQSFDAAIKSSNERNDNLSDKLLDLARGRSDPGQPAEPVPRPQPKR